MNHEDGYDGMHRKWGAFEPQTKRQILKNRPRVHPPRHHRIEAQGSRNRRPLEILALPRCILRENLHRNIEARQPRQTTKNEKGKTDGVERGAKA